MQHDTISSSNDKKAVKQIDMSFLFNCSCCINILDMMPEIYSKVVKFKGVTFVLVDEV